MKRFLTTVLLTAAIAGAQAENTFILDIDDASRVRFETGMTSATYVEQTLVNGANTITQSGSEDFVLTPKSGYLIESITAYALSLIHISCSTAPNFADRALRSGRLSPCRRRQSARPGPES